MGKKWVKGVAQLHTFTAHTCAVILWFCVIPAKHGFAEGENEIFI